MHALRWHGPGQLQLDDVPEPAFAKSGEAIVAVEFCGICGTDVHEYVSGPHMIRPTAHPYTGARPPITLGHEISGRVVEIGPNGPDIAVGTRVSVDPCWRCGVCRSCRAGQYQVCDLGGSVGLASPGGLARYVTVPARGLAVIPANVTFEVAALGEPLSVGLHAVRRGDVRPGDTVAVVGGGPIGAACVLAARAAGAVRVLVSEPRPERREIIARLGVTGVYDTSEPFHRVVRRESDGGADVVFETSGAAPALENALKAARRRGTVVLPALGSVPYPIDGRQLVLYERRLVGTLGYNYDLPRVLDLIATGVLDPSPMITGTYPLIDAARVIAEIAAGTGTHFKPLIQVGEGS